MHVYATNRHVLIYDLETIPDLTMTKRAFEIPDDTPDIVAAAFNDRFPPACFHEIVAIAALRLRFENSSWIVDALGAPSRRERSERDLIRDFVTAINNDPCLIVTFNGSHFDMATLRYRAMLHRLPAPGLHKQRYYHRYSTEAHQDLLDILSCYDARARMSLDVTCRALDLPGKMPGMDGSQVRDLVSEGRYQEIEAYAIRDVLATACLWLRYQLFYGALTIEGHGESQQNLARFIADRPHRFEPSLFKDFVDLSTK